MSREKDQREVNQYWEDMENQIGEKILEKALIRVINSRPLDLKDKWLLFFSSSTGLYYKRFPAGSVMASLFNTVTKEKEYTLEYLPWQSIRYSFKVKRGFLSRIFSSPQEAELQWGKEQFFLLELDSRSQNIFQNSREII